MTKAEEILKKEITLFEWGKKNDKQLITYEDALKAVNKAINYTHSCAELGEKHDFRYICENQICLEKKCKKCGELS